MNSKIHGRSEKESARKKGISAGGRFENQLLLFLFRDCSGSLSGVGLCQTLLELVNPPGGVHEFLHTGVKRVADIANSHHDGGLGGTCLDDVATSASNLCIQVFWMNISFHI